MELFGTVRRSMMISSQALCALLFIIVHIEMEQEG